MSALLEVEGLRVALPTPDGELHAVRSVDFSVDEGRTLCLVGESGCGKTLTALALMGLLPRQARRHAARLHFDCEDLRHADETRLTRLRGDRLAMIFQEPMTALNPAYTIGAQLEEALRLHRRVGRRAARERATFLLSRVGVESPAHILAQYPHQLSGGQRQRAMIAMALMCGPKLVIADEPTASLDAVTRLKLLDLLRDLQAEFGLALILITHDLGVAARAGDRVAVMYAGQIVEQAPARELFASPLHPYTQALLRAAPALGAVPRPRRLGAIPGAVPNLIGLQPGCSFADRCAHVFDACRAHNVSLAAASAERIVRCLLPPAEAARLAKLRPAVNTGGDAPPRDPAALLEARNVSRNYHLSQGLFRAARPIAAVAGVSLTLRRGEVLALVGESGSGKSTLARLLMGLEPPDSGEVLLDGQKLSSLGRVGVARRVQPVFQNPYGSLNPGKTVAAIVGLPLAAHGIGAASERRRRVAEMIDRVGLPQRALDLYPRELSGGQRQRVAIARALVMTPDIVICDEPTSALDVSVQAQILNLLQDLQRDFSLTYLLISHDLAVVAQMATRVAIMRNGVIVEESDVDTATRAPTHPHTQELLAAALDPVAVNRMRAAAPSGI